ncbi:uncharacterized protein LOC5512121 [Nematostella vectensis]|uniref:uncharacterized protein LOC5512121 n=1 Tax=Nematostella vectensis TaxID=45351 RepID=UPI00207724CF|nr:uncharacterized protein LOC5512121 [Nematostella vectensis]
MYSYIIYTHTPRRKKQFAKALVQNNNCESYSSKMVLAFLTAVLFLACSTTYACDPKPMIIANEGQKPCMYLDIKGIKTIGVGYNMERSSARADFKSIGADFDKFYNGPLTKSTKECNCTAVPCLKEAQVYKLLDISLVTAVKDAQSVISTFESLCCSVQNTMVDMSFTLGGSSFRQFTTFAKFIERQRWKMAGDDLTVSKWCNAKGQDVNRCHRDAAIVAKGCGCTGQYSQTCTQGPGACCATAESCCKASFTYKGFITKTFDETGCCPFTKATCCTHNKCCKEGTFCCPSEPAVPTYCCPVDYPNCLPNQRCGRGDDVIEGFTIHHHG